MPGAQDRIVAGVGLVQFASRLGDQLSDQPARLLVIVDDQDRELQVWDQSSGLVPGRRQIDHERGAVPGSVRGGHGPSEPGDDVTGDAETKSRAFAGRLGGDPRVEDVGQDLRRDAAPGVGHFDAHMRAGAWTPRA